MAEHEFGTMDTSQSEHAWNVFVKFWKYLIILSVVVLIFLATTV